MTKPLGAEQTEKGRIYIDPDTGERYPSVTTIKDMYAKDFLKFWYAKMAGIRAVEEFTELYKRIRIDGEESARKWVSAAAKDSNGPKARQGDDVHDLADKLIKGENILWDALHPKTLDMVSHFNAWRKEHNVQYVASELSMANRSIGFGGATDGIAVIPALSSLPVIVDLKTSEEEKGPYLDWAFQLAAYSRMEIMFAKQEDGILSTSPVPEIDQTVGVNLRLSPNGYAMFVSRDLETWFEVFKHLRAIWVSCGGDDRKIAGETYELYAEGAGEPVDFVAERLCQARSEGELSFEWMRAKKTGEWQEHHTEIAAKRKAELRSQQTAA